MQRLIERADQGKRQQAEARLAKAVRSSVEMTRDHAVSTPAMSNVASSRINSKVMPLRATAGRWSTGASASGRGAVD